MPCLCQELNVHHSQGFLDRDLTTALTRLGLYNCYCIVTPTCLVGESDSHQLSKVDKGGQPSSIQIVCVGGGEDGHLPSKVAEPHQPSVVESGGGGWGRQPSIVQSGGGGEAHQLSRVGGGDSHQPSKGGVRQLSAVKSGVGWMGRQQSGVQKGRVALYQGFRSFLYLKKH